MHRRGYSLGQSHPPVLTWRHLATMYCSVIFNTHSTSQGSLTQPVTAYVYGVHHDLVATVNFLCAKAHHSLSLTSTEHRHMSTITVFHHTYPHFYYVLCIPTDSTPTNICGNSLIHKQRLSKLMPRGPDQASKHATSGEQQCGPSARVPSWLFMSCLFKCVA